MPCVELGASARKKLIDEELRRIGRELLKTVA